MALNTVPIFPKTPQSYSQQILPADTSTKKDLVTGGADGTKFLGGGCTSTETTTARVVQLWSLIGAVLKLLNSVSVPLNAGFDGVVPPVSLFAAMTWLPIDNDGQRYYFVKSGEKLQVNTTTTVSAGKEVDIHGVGGDFS